MRKQEHFNKVWNHFIVNRGEPSILAEGPGCRYRRDLTPECPVRCAIGLEIPDELYTVDMENKPLWTVLELAGVDLDLSFAEASRSCHDHAARVSGRGSSNFHTVMEARLRNLAAQWQLTVPRSMMGDY